MEIFSEISYSHDILLRFRSHLSSQNLQQRIMSAYGKIAMAKLSLSLDLCGFSLLFQISWILSLEVTPTVALMVGTQSQECTVSFLYFDILMEWMQYYLSTASLMEYII